VTFSEQNMGKATPRNKSRACMLTWPDGSAEQVHFVTNLGGGMARVERNYLDGDGQREQMDVRLTQLEWR